VKNLLKVERADDLAEAFQPALAAKGPTLVDVMTDPLLT
jgi:thiamine pyrophosphate-dependent acetolactate synthase large subunit-like protein